MVTLRKHAGLLPEQAALHMHYTCISEQTFSAQLQALSVEELRLFTKPFCFFFSSQIAHAPSSGAKGAWPQELAPLRIQGAATWSDCLLVTLGTRAQATLVWISRTSDHISCRKWFRSGRSRRRCGVIDVGAHQFHLFQNRPRQMLLWVFA